MATTQANITEYMAKLVTRAAQERIASRSTADEHAEGRHMGMRRVYEDVCHDLQWRIDHSPSRGRFLRSEMKRYVEELKGSLDHSRKVAADPHAFGFNSFGGAQAEGNVVAYRMVIIELSKVLGVPVEKDIEEEVGVTTQ